MPPAPVLAAEIKVFWPGISVWRLPPISTTADSLVALISLTPSGEVSPALSVRGLPPSITSTALPLNRPMTATSAAGAASGAISKIAASKLTFLIVYSKRVIHEASDHIQARGHRRAWLFCHISLAQQ